MISSSVIQLPLFFRHAMNNFAQIFFGQFPHETNCVYIYEKSVMYGWMCVWACASNYLWTRPDRGLISFANMLRRSQEPKNSYKYRMNSQLTLHSSNELAIDTLINNCSSNINQQIVFTTVNNTRVNSNNLPYECGKNDQKLLNLGNWIAKYRQFRARN